MNDLSFKPVPAATTDFRSEADDPTSEVARFAAHEPLRLDAGPVEPMQPPITFEQMMKYLPVSSGLPGPTMVSHQPGLPVTGCTLATC